MPSSLTPPEPTPPPPKPPFDAAKWAMILLAVLVCTPALLTLVTTMRCAIALVPECWDRPWPTIFRDWLSETIPVLVAIIMTGRRSPPD
jgi:hypothetical protein